MNAETPTNNDLSKSTTTTIQKDYNMEYIAETQINNDLSKLTTTTTQEVTTMINNAKTLMNNDSSNLILGDYDHIIAHKNLDSANLPPQFNQKDIKVIRDIFGNEQRFTPVNHEKRPYLKEWQKYPKTLDYCLSCLESNSKCKGLGLITGNGYLAIDFDGHNAWKLAKEMGLGELAEANTLAWSSGKEGRQQKLFKIPQHRLNDFQKLSRKAIKSYQNVSEVEKEQLEIRYERMQSVLPPSVHPETGKYSWINTNEPLELAVEQCDRILNLFEDKKPTKLEKLKAKQDNIDFSANDYKEKASPELLEEVKRIILELNYPLPSELLIEELAKSYRNVSNLLDGRTTELFSIAQYLGEKIIRLGLEPNLAKEILFLASKNNRKVDKEGEKYVLTQITNGLRLGADTAKEKIINSNKREPYKDNPELSLDIIIDTLTSDLTPEKKLDKIHKTIAPTSQKKTIINLIKLDYGERLRYNEYNFKIELDGNPIEDLELFYLNLAEENFIDTNKDLAIDVITKLAKNNSYNPLKNYFEELEKRKDLPKVDIKKLATLFFGTDDSIYDTYVYKHLIGSVARIYEAGCQKDEVLVLKGKQGYFKSSFFCELYGKEYFTDSVKNTDRDNLLILHENWCCELAELDHITGRKESGELKAFITSKTDSFRKPYARSTTRRGRTSVFVASVNKSEFLIDETGNRRFWVIPINKPINIEKVKQLRDSIWLEVYKAYKNGEVWHLTKEEQEYTSRLNQQFETQEGWESDGLIDFLTPFETIGISAHQILTQYLKKEEKDITGVDKRRISSILSKLGWEKLPSKKVIEGKQRQVWINPNSIQNKIAHQEINSENKETLEPIKLMLISLIKELYVIYYGRYDSNISLETMTMEELQDEKNRIMNHFRQKFNTPKTFNSENNSW